MGVSNGQMGTTVAMVMGLARLVVALRRSLMQVFNWPCLGGDGALRFTRLGRLESVEEEGDGNCCVGLRHATVKPGIHCLYVSLSIS